MGGTAKLPKESMTGSVTTKKRPATPGISKTGKTGRGKLDHNDLIKGKGPAATASGT